MDHLEIEPPRWADDYIIMLQRLGATLSNSFYCKRFWHKTPRYLVNGPPDDVNCMYLIYLQREKLKFHIELCKLRTIQRQRTDLIIQTYIYNLISNWQLNFD